MWEVGLISEKDVYRKMRLPIHPLTSGGTDQKSTLFQYADIHTNPYINQMMYQCKKVSIIQ